MMLLCLALLSQAPGDSISLSQALEHARQGRGTLAAAAAGVAEARSALRVAGAIPNPTVTYSHSESTPRNHLLVDQPLDWLLRRGHDRSAARAGVERALTDSALAAYELTRNVRVSFYRARASSLAEALVRAQAALGDSVRRIAAARLRAGDIPLLEEEQAAQEAARARQTYASAREMVRSDQVELARAIGWQGTAPVPVGALDAGLDLLPDSAIDLAALPAVRTAAADSAAAAAQARSAASARVPFPTIQSGAEWGDESQPGALAVVGVAIPFPLWNLGNGAYGEARARAARAAAQVREARLEAERQVRLARIHLEETAARARFARDTILPGAAVLRQRAVRAYRAGETGILPVLDALRGEREASIAALQDQLAFQEALADWYALTGREE
jgi:outer membrane protein, heavy metal efflux system